VQPGCGCSISYPSASPKKLDLWSEYWQVGNIKIVYFPSVPNIDWHEKNEHEPVRPKGMQKTYTLQTQQLASARMKFPEKYHYTKNTYVEQHSVWFSKSGADQNTKIWIIRYRQDNKI
jgi:hypothetical protein